MTPPLLRKEKLAQDNNPIFLKGNLQDQDGLQDLLLSVVMRQTLLSDRQSQLSVVWGVQVYLYVYIHIYQIIYYIFDVCNLNTVSILKDENEVALG